MNQQFIKMQKIASEFIIQLDPPIPPASTPASCPRGPRDSVRSWLPCRTGTWAPHLPWKRRCSSDFWSMCLLNSLVSDTKQFESLETWDIYIIVYSISIGGYGIYALDILCFKHNLWIWGCHEETNKYCYASSLQSWL